MNSADRKTIDNVIRINSCIPILQDKIEKEQSNIISDMSKSAIKTVTALIALDNRRIDLCNLNVMYGFIRRKLGDKFGVFIACVNTRSDSALYDLAREAIGECGYDVQRVRDEFAYLFKQLKPVAHAKRESVIAAAIMGNLRA